MIMIDKKQKNNAHLPATVSNLKSQSWVTAYLTPLSKQSRSGNFDQNNRLMLLID